MRKAEKIKILFEDNHLLVIEKPVNIPVQADSSSDPDLLGMLKADLKERYNKPGNVYLGLVHRLDRPAGGLMVFAKTSKAAGRLDKQIRERRLEKEYFAVVRGIPPAGKNRLIHYLFKNTAANTVKVVTADTAGAKEAVLDYETVMAGQKLALVRINLLTGRPHQIRVQFAAIGHPLYGDQKYGAELNKPGEQLALWSAKLGFGHPVSKETVWFTSRPPEEYPWSLFRAYFENNKLE